MSGGLIDDAKAKVHKGWTTFKKVLGALSVWGLIFSLVTIGRLKVAVDYDDTLVFSTPAYEQARKSGAQPFSPGYWSVVNKSYDLERTKYLPNTLAWILRLFGFKVTILADRPPDGGEPLKKEWRRLASRFVFVRDSQEKRKLLGQDGYVLYFGDSDSDITDGRQARVLTLRVRRSPKSSFKEDYHPGSLGEFVIPLSQY